MTCFYLPHNNVSFDITSDQEILSGAVRFDIADCMGMTMITICQGTCININQD